MVDDTIPAGFAIAERFCGPPGTANGGYVAGRLARGLPGAVEVTLRAPAPLATPLDVSVSADGARVLAFEGKELARAVATELRLEVPAPPALEVVAAVAGNCRGMRTHPFPRDFVCGPARAPGDGLRIFPGVVPGTDRVAALWRPDPSLAGVDGDVRPEFLWAALDSPSSFPLLEPESARALEPMVLGRFCVALDGGLRANEDVILLAWPIAREGRRGISGAALFSGAGVCVGRARATWVSIAPRS
jgi:hypothetical protein